MLQPRGKGETARGEPRRAFDLCLFPFASTATLFLAGSGWRVLGAKKEIQNAMRSRKLEQDGAQKSEHDECCSSHDLSPCIFTMWSFASHAVAGSLVSRSNMLKPRQVTLDCSDDEVSPSASKEEVLECPICWESFNIVENVPYVLWCGHTLCKNCVLKIQWAIVNFPALPIQLPLFISCPWCHCLSLRLLYRGQLKFPRKNFSLLWMVESMNNHHSKWFNQDQFSSTSTTLLLGETSNHHQRQESMPTTSTQHMHSDNSHANSRQTSLLNYSGVGNIQFSLQKLLAFVIHLSAKFPLVVICLFVVLYVIPATAAILALYILVTLLFALPSLLILYFAYPGLDWLIREITS